jgi:hypothetical protein
VHQDIGTILNEKKRPFLKRSERSQLHLKLCFFLLFSFALLLSPAKGIVAAEPGTELNVSKEKIAIFDFENLSGADDVLTHVMPAVMGLMKSKGFDLPDEKSLNDFLIMSVSDYRLYFERVGPKDGKR